MGCNGDHLGNIRLSYSDLDLNGAIDPGNEILDEKNYYPFGGEHKGYNSVINGTYHPYGFGGKEENDELGLQWMDFGARNYDKWLGRWMNLDPLAEQMRRHSPYNYAFDNPIYFIDPDGMAPQENDCCGNNLPGINPIAVGQSAYKGMKAAGTFLNNLMVGGYNFVSGRGTNKDQRKGDNSIKTINADDIIAVSPSSANSLNSKGSIVKKIVQGASDASEEISKIDKVVSNIESNATKEIDKDTTFITTKAGSIETNVVSDTQVSSFGNVEKVEVTVPKSQVNSVNEASQQSLNKQIKDMDDANTKKMDSLRNARNGS